MKRSSGDYKLSEVFENGLQVGECFIEPFLDYTDDLLYGTMKFKKTDYYYVFPDPDAREYDLSDGEYIDKVTYDLTKDQLLSLFPDNEDEIEKIGDQGKLSLDNIGQLHTDELGTSIQKKGYGDATPGKGVTPFEPTYDLLEHFYKKYIPSYFVADVEEGWVKKASSKEEAEAYVNTVKREAEAKRMEMIEAGQELPDLPETVKVIKRMIPHYWVASVVGNTNQVLDDRACWSFPRWKGWPIIPFYVYRSTAPLKGDARVLAVQGIVRGMKDPQRELNKRRTQELRILNSTANSGWISVKDSWVSPDDVEEYGSTPGVNLEWDYDKAHGVAPSRITPAPLSQGHAQLAAENTQDLKELSGINTDLLAMTEGGQSSGKAIAIRQRQGLVMVQKIFDNLSQTKRLLGRFILSQLSDIYDVETAIKVMGEAFVKQNFSVPVTAPVVDPKTGQPAIGPDGKPLMAPQIGPDGQPVTQVDQKAVVNTFNKVLNDTQLGLYDVSIGESAQNETVRLSNFMTLMDMVGQGMPIPPDVLIDESLLSTASKEKIKAAIQRAQAAATAAPAKGKPPQNG
jgi:hypothetical protein